MDEISSRIMTEESFGGLLSVSKVFFVIMGIILMWLKRKI